MNKDSVTFRLGTRADVGAVVGLLREDELGVAREGEDLEVYLAAFDAMTAEAGNTLIVGELDGAIVAAYQLTFISGLSRRASRRAQIESVRVRGDLRGQGVGGRMMADAEARARTAGCRLLQLTSDVTRTEAQAFYGRLGYVPSHVGYKKALD